MNKKTKSNPKGAGRENLTVPTKRIAVPVDKIDVVKELCKHPFDFTESTFGGGTLCVKCRELI